MLIENFTNRIKEKFGSDVPIFTGEILRLFPECSRAQVFRYIKKAKERAIIQK